MHKKCLTNKLSVFHILQNLHIAGYNIHASVRVVHILSRHFWCDLWLYVNTEYLFCSLISRFWVCSLFFTWAGQVLWQPAEEIGKRNDREWSGRQTYKLHYCFQIHWWQRRIPKGNFCCVTLNVANLCYHAHFTFTYLLKFLTIEEIFCLFLFYTVLCQNVGKTINSWFVYVYGLWRSYD